MLKILHTSDNQLGAPFRFLGSRGEGHRRRLREAFQRIVDLAAQGFDVMLIAGDLFNDGRPRQDTLGFVTAQLARLDIPVCILPGNHDPYDDTSIYRRERFPENVRIFTQDPHVEEFDWLDLAVHGNPVLSRQSRLSPMRGLTRTGAMRWQVAMAHGNLVRPDIVDPPRPIRPEEISTSGMDYVALGDWHAFAKHSQGEVKAFYSGAPEPCALDQSGAGYVACVEMDDSGVRVLRERVGTVTTGEISVDVSGKSAAQIVEEIKVHADPNRILRCRLSGLVELGTVLDSQKLEQELAARFYHIECSDQSQPQLAAVSQDDFPEESVIGRFVRLMQARIAEAGDDSERQQAEQALQLGVALLQGKRVL